uniref:gamma-1-syntrophin-like isoform X1 n=2 Tax=Ciona intestinalis TaxID=7719 RepID=UPI0005216D21|nr:gamma-1-syntrophin-like isoform X1 [Ciona intestinalis]|eukprot:XP_009860867.1 gamma-1-syntrophin-like isoform X1 [Ciona intestinalis]
MKEAVLALRDGAAERKVIVKLTDNQLIINDIIPDNSVSLNKPTNQTNSISPASCVTPTFSRQTTASISSTESGSRGASKDTSDPLLSTDQTNSTIMPTGSDVPGERVVKIKRQPGGGLGISVKGGAEHGIPVLISRVFPGQAADQTHLLHPGDAILAVNDKRVDRMMHDEVVSELRLCGAEVALTVRAFDGAGHVLRPSVSSATPSKNSTSSDQPPTNNENIHEHSNESAQDAIELRAVIADAKHRNFGDVQTDPNSSTHLDYRNDPNASTHLEYSNNEGKEKIYALAFARLERYINGTDQSRNNCFEVIPHEGESTGLIICSNKSELNEWISSVTATIHKATMSQTNDSVTQERKVSTQGWLSERSNEANITERWSPRFVAIRVDKIYIFDTPPESELDWEQCSRVFTLYESLCKSHLPPRHLLDNREHCLSIQHSTKPPIYCSAQCKDEITLWEESLQKATHEAVYKLQKQSYECVCNNRKCEFIIHFNHGFKLEDSVTQETLWEYKFSQLKGSSDDRKTQITFTFQNRTTGQLDKQSFTSEQAYPLLFCVHAFLAAKLALVDPGFLKKANSAHAQNHPTPAAPTLTNGNAELSY